MFELYLTAGKTANMQQLLSHMLSSVKHEIVIDLQVCHGLILYTSGFLF